MSKGLSRCRAGNEYAYFVLGWQGAVKSFPGKRPPAPGPAPRRRSGGVKGAASLAYDVCNSTRRNEDFQAGKGRGEEKLRRQAPSLPQKYAVSAPDDVATGIIVRPRGAVPADNPGSCADKRTGRGENSCPTVPGGKFHSLPAPATTDSACPAPQRVLPST